MAVAALKLKPQRKMFYATVHVTRVEEWCVWKRRVRRKRGSYWLQGEHRRQCVNVEVEQVEG